MSPSQAIQLGAHRVQSQCNAANTSATMATSFERPTNSHLPKEHPQYAEFSRTYPNGLPYGMELANGPHGPEAIPTKYVENNIPIGFYVNPPGHSPAIFSTELGKKPFRTVEHFLPPRQLRIFSAAEIQAYCNNIRKKFWAQMKELADPVCWEDLYKYFDSHDLYWRGAQNMWNVLKHLWAENSCLLANMWASQAIEIGIWTDQWLMRPENKEKLRGWNQSWDIAHIFTSEDWEDTADITEAQRSWLKEALIYRFHQLFSADKNQSLVYPKNTMSDAWANSSLHNWLGKFMPITPQLIRTLT
jgi:hypothetical protein